MTRRHLQVIEIHHDAPVQSGWPWVAFAIACAVGLISWADDCAREWSEYETVRGEEPSE